METVLQDIRVTLRAFRRSPGFPLTAIATLALGIGATTAIFTALSAVLLKPLPYPNPDDLYSLRTALTDGRVTTGLLSGEEFFGFNNRNCPSSAPRGSSPATSPCLPTTEPHPIPRCMRYPKAFSSCSASRWPRGASLT